MQHTLKSKIQTGLDIFKSLYLIKFAGKKIPIYCEWEITSYCNMTCAFCSTYISDRNAANLIPREDAFRILDQLIEMGTKIIHFSGGEPTLWKDLPELAEKASQKNIVVSMTTNGSSSLERMEKFLHLDLIRVSLDGTEEFHDSVRMFPGAYKKALTTLRFLRSKGKKPIIASVFLESSSFEMLRELARIAQDLDVQLAVNIHGNHGDAIGPNGKPNSSKNNGSYLRYVSALKQLQAEFGDVIANPEPVLSVIGMGGLDVYGCRAMDIAIVINADGSVSLPCNRWPNVKKKGDIRDIYYSEEAEEARRLQGRAPTCVGCGARCMASASSLLNLRGLTAIVGGYAKSVF